MFRRSCPWPKVCNHCGQAKPIEQFRLKCIKGDRAGDRAPYCNECRKEDPRTKEYARRSYYKDHEKSLRLHRERQQRHRLKRHPFSIIKFKLCNICESEYITINNKRIYCLKCSREIAKIKYQKDADYRELRKEKSNKKNDIDRFLLKDNYIKKLLTKRNSLTQKDIPYNLIAFYREILKIKREISKPKLKGEMYVKYQ